MAHQGYSSLQHQVEYFADEIAEGWKKEGDSILINPKVYAERPKWPFGTQLLFRNTNNSLTKPEQSESISISAVGCGSVEQPNSN